jgi:hypothetical protein
MININVLCPGGSVTGGPELLHQLVHTINQNGGNANIVYFPFNKKFDIPSEYEKYHVKIVQNTTVSSDSIVIIPEIATGFLKYYKTNRVFIWWLSVDNYFKAMPNNIYQKIKFLVKKSIRHQNSPLSLDNMAGVEHLTQSYYAKEFLLAHGYQSEMLSDYLNDNHFINNMFLTDKVNIISYNPKKGYEYTKKLIEKFPEIKFIPIVNMTASQVSKLLMKSKVYIDFGNHPGKDRIPREAAMADCVVITGRAGSAKNAIDIAVDSKYKLDTNSHDFEDNFKLIIDDVFCNFNDKLRDFSSYRDKIIDEKNEFNCQVIEFMAKSDVVSK